MFTLLLAVFSTLLARFSRQDDVVVRGCLGGRDLAMLLQCSCSPGRSRGLVVRVAPGRHHPHQPPLYSFFNLKCSRRK